jgi:hypothetical protein
MAEVLSAVRTGHPLHQKDSWDSFLLEAESVAGSSPDKVIFFFLIYLILPAASWFWGRLSLLQG